MGDIVLADASDPLEVRLSKKLWAAVFWLAVDDAIKDKFEGRYWLECEDHCPGSFSWLCEVFGHDPIYIRRIIKGKYR